MKSKHLIFTCVIIMVFYSCKHSKTSYIDYFTEKYSSKELNLFYQACFNDTVGYTTFNVYPRDTLYRWEKDINYCIKGGADSSQIHLIDSVMSHYNGIGLPIKLKNRDSLHSNLSVKLIKDPYPLSVPFANTSSRHLNYSSLSYEKCTINNAAIYIFNKNRKKALVATLTRCRTVSQNRKLKKRKTEILWLYKEKPNTQIGTGGNEVRRMTIMDYFQAYYIEDAGILPIV
ncbi:MAG: hypothetical protein ACOCP4_07765 [Candidatus Woesearchaeota archaeon]